ncbi:carbonic anhydrase [Nemania serpens]|nr:carbonic anhydrase [Nemania serpens]
MTSSLASELLKRAEALSKDHQPAPNLPDLGLGPQKMIFCCFDPRVDPVKFLGLTAADGVLVVRNASGSPAGNIFDIVALDSLLGISEVIIVKHTDCGATYMTGHDVRNHITKHNPGLAGTLDDLPDLTTTDIVQKTRDDVDLVKSSPLVRKELRDTVSGLLYDIKTGKVSKIV